MRDIFLPQARVPQPCEDWMSQPRMWIPRCDKGHSPFLARFESRTAGRSWALWSRTARASITCPHVFYEVAWGPRARVSCKDVLIACNFLPDCLHPCPSASKQICPSSLVQRSQKPRAKIASPSPPGLFPWPPGGEVGRATPVTEGPHPRAERGGQMWGGRGFSGGWASCIPLAVRETRGGPSPGR